MDTFRRVADTKKRGQGSSRKDGGANHYRFRLPQTCSCSPRSLSPPPPPFAPGYAYVYASAQACTGAASPPSPPSLVPFPAHLVPFPRFYTAEHTDTDTKRKRKHPFVSIPIPILLDTHAAASRGSGTRMGKVEEGAEGAGAGVEGVANSPFTGDHTFTPSLALLVLPVVVVHLVVVTVVVPAAVVTTFTPTADALALLCHCPCPCRVELGDADTAVGDVRLAPPAGEDTAHTIPGGRCGDLYDGGDPAADVGLGASGWVRGKGVWPAPLCPTSPVATASSAATDAADGRKGAPPIDTPVAAARARRASRAWKGRKTQAPPNRPRPCASKPSPTLPIAPARS
ncbi:hypothetical protein C8F04DRAFT_1277972 [Mycena alexandri]|uniref:Uncharacterized protein n=1 Tax=Mycena alexandri TaxID=1745969 RepID=A0AAD6RZG4_9AGAR|nr:hypothetical protein C8F04DRAFT_1277972 [Mycena alexandri]